MMKKNLTAVLASAVALALVLSGCGGDKSSDKSGSASGSNASSAVSSGSSSGSEKQERPLNDKVFMNGADFTGMTQIRNESHADNTYFYQDQTEDGLTYISNFCIPTQPRWLEGGTEEEEIWETLVREAADSEAYDIWGEGAGEETLGKGDADTYYAEWYSGHNEDTQFCHGVFAVTENYTYVYYFSIDVDAENFDEMQDIFGDILTRVQLETVKE